jgi:hypothetical protein
MGYLRIDPSVDARLQIQKDHNLTRKFDVEGLPEKRLILVVLSRALQ